MIRKHFQLLVESIQGNILGMRIGNNVSRIGIDSIWFQDFIKNGWHKKIGSPFYNTELGPPSRLFIQGGYNFPYSLYPY